MDNDDVEALLAKLRDDPVDNTGATAEVLGRVYSYLLAVPKHQNGRLHWFCNRAVPVTIAAASFLLRLFAYDGKEAEIWRGNLNSCLAGCCDCVASLETIRVTSRTTYFAKFAPEILENFWAGFDIWDVEQVVSELEKVKITHKNLDPMVQTLSDVPSPIVLRLMSSWAAFSDQRIQTIIHSIPPHTIFHDWPTTTIPPGVLALLVEQTSAVRQWASSQASRYPATPLPADRFTGGYIRALEILIYGLTSRDSPNASSEQFSFFLFAADTFDLWAGFSTTLRFLPVKYLKSTDLCKTDIRKVVSGHLSDIDIHFIEVLRCFIFLLKRLEASFWTDEAPGYPLVVFDAVKNNPAFGKLVQSIPNAKQPDENLWYLSWIHEYFYSVQKLEAIHETVVAKVSDFLLEELQHERFGEARPLVLESAARFLSSILSKVAHGHTHPLAERALLSAIDIHANTLTRVSFHRDYDKAQWSRARELFRQFLGQVLLRDIQDTSAVIIEASSLLGHVALKKPAFHVPPLSIRKGLWPKVYQSVHPQDPDGLANVLRLVSEGSHIDVLRRNTFEPILSVTGIGDGYTNGGALVTTINTALSTMRAGFLEGARNFVDYSTPSQLLKVLKSPGVAKAAMVLLLSPVDDFHTMAKVVVGQAFEVDGRLECIRALLENLPDPAIDGLVDFLHKFCSYATSVPEACSLSKSLVRCFTDVIDVLCSKHDGLLRNSQFLRPNDPQGPASRMMELWTLMSKAIAVIFRRTPSWSLYFDSAEMIEWMRDALIFGRDMLAQWQVIGDAAKTFCKEQKSQSEPKLLQKSLSEIERKMIGCFQDVLTELTRWLRLTDEELLHQSFSLLQSLLELFRKADVRPCHAAFTKLTRYVNSARKDVDNTRSRLDSSRVATLNESLAAFDDDDEIEIISEKIVSRPAKQVAQEQKLVTKAKDEPKSSTSISREGRKVEKNFILKHSKSKPTISHHFEKVKPKIAGSSQSLPATEKRDKPVVNSVTQQVSQMKPKPKEHYKNEAKIPASSESSSESGESESENEAPTGGLARLGKKFAKSPKIKKPAERRQIKFLHASMGESIELARIRQREEAHRAKMRMRPDLSGLHRTLLSWNYDHDGPLPPGFNHKLAPIPDVFADLNHFYRVFEPLLLLECWAQIAQAKDETPDIYECKITSKQYIDDWLELDISFETIFKKDFYLSPETDIVLLRHPQTKKSILAKTKGFVSNYQGVQASLRCYLKAGVEDPGLLISTSWKISKVFSLSTLNREYAALKSLPYYDSANTILQPRLQRTSPPGQAEVKRAMEEFKINEPQAVAILKGMNTGGFTLIQGPPGTGKTSTICGLVSLFLAKQPKPAVPIHVGNNAPAQRPLPKVLLCAPSNAAIDEIARRVKDGYKGPEKGGDSVKVVRIGAEQSMNILVKDISLDYLVDQAIDPPKDGNKSGEIVEVRKELEAIRAKKDQLYKELEETADGSRAANLQAEIGQLNSRRTALASRIDRLKDEQKSASRTLDALRRSTRQKILLEANVICSTLSGAGHEIIEQLDFDMIIIDEAAQAIELSTLIPLKYQCQRCILVGDPQQLPPTVLSQEASKYRYNQSLFVRMQKSQPDAVHLLSIQYRMHPDISQLPSAVFYQGKLKDGPKMDEKTTQPWHRNPLFGTYKFFNVSKGLEESSGRSIKNVAECRAAVALFNRLRVEYTRTNLDHRIGVVSMYRAQITELKRQFEQRFGKDILGRVDFNTVDGFQGQEKDVIILSCVRAGPGLQSVGFLSDTRRMNVALTRAKSSLFILGNAATLERSDTNWRATLEDARRRSCLVEADHSYFTKSIPTTEPIATPRAAKPSKPTAKPASNPVPADLFQPQNVKQSKPPSHAIPGSSNAQTGISASGHHPKPHVQAIGVKRPAEDSSSSKGENDTRPLPPPTKRPKKAPNIFIPKTKKP